MAPFTPKDNFCISVAAMIITGETDETLNAAKESVRSLLGFYATTPAYKPPMDAIGKGDLQPLLNRLSKEGKWQELASYIDDEFLHAFAIIGKPEDIPELVHQRYGGIANRLGIYAPYAAPDAMWKGIIRGIKNYGGQTF